MPRLVNADFTPEEHARLNTYPDEVRQAAKLGLVYGYQKGENHRAWVIDQMLRALLSPEDYALMTDTTGQSLSWDVGVAP